MGLREELEKRIVRKQDEIREHEDRIREAKAYLQGLQDTLKLIPKDDASGVADVALRHGSNIGRARDVLRAAGKPMHITDILRAMNQPTDKKHRLALGGSLAAYVRKNLIFTRPAPNTFGLVELVPKHFELNLGASFAAGDTGLIKGGS